MDQHVALAEIFTQSVASQGLTCHTFNQLSVLEQRQFLNGYRLGAAMELKFFKTNILTPRVIKALEKSPNDILQAVAEWGTDAYLDGKYKLINITVVYPAEFSAAVKRDCKQRHSLGIGMFNVLPSTLTKCKRQASIRCGECERYTRITLSMARGSSNRIENHH